MNKILAEKKNTEDWSIKAVVKVMFRFVREVVQVFFRDDISIQGITCAPRICDEVLPILSKIR